RVFPQPAPRLRGAAPRPLPVRNRTVAQACVFASQKVVRLTCIPRMYQRLRKLRPAQAFSAPLNLAKPWLPKVRRPRRVVGFFLRGYRAHLQGAFRTDTKKEESKW